MKVIDFIKNIEIPEVIEIHPYTIDLITKTVRVGNVDIFSTVDYTIDKISIIRDILSDYNIKTLYLVPTYKDNVLRYSITWISSDFKFVIIWGGDCVIPPIVFDVQKIRENDDSYSILEYGKILLEEMEILGE